MLNKDVLHQSLDRTLRIEVYKIDSIVHENGLTKDIFRLKYRKLNLYQYNDLGIDVVIIDPEKYVMPLQEPLVEDVTDSLAIKAIFKIIKKDENDNLIYEDIVDNAVYSNVEYIKDADIPYLKSCIRVNTDITKTPCEIKLELTVYDKITKNYVTLPELIDMKVLPSMLETPSDENSDLIYILNHPVNDEFDVIINKDKEYYYPEDVMAVKGVKTLLEEIKVQYEETQNLIKNSLKAITLTVKPGVGRDRFICSDSTVEIDDSIGTELKLKMPQTIKSAFLSTVAEADAQAFVATVSSFSRLQFYIKRIDYDTITLQCFNSEKIMESVYNEVTEEYEDKVVMDIGVINLDKLPKIYMTINILYMV